MNKNEKCPNCGSKEIAQGKQMGQGKMVPIDSLGFSFGSNVIADICTECGNILRTKVDRPGKFK